MKNESRIIHLQNQGFYVETPTGTHGPVESKEEARDLLSLMLKVNAAGSEIVCTDKECL